jgi:hypothetical protein
MTRFTGWLAHLDVPTLDGRILTTPFDGPALLPGELRPVLGPAPGPMRTSWVGEVREIWVEDGWLRGNGEINVGALPIGYRGQPKIGAEIDVSGGTHEVTVKDRRQIMTITGWKLDCVVIGDRPAWPDARLEIQR